MPLPLSFLERDEIDDAGRPGKYSSSSSSVTGSDSEALDLYSGGGVANSDTPVLDLLLLY
jgi:hypothetical protein